MKKAEFVKCGKRASPSLDKPPASRITPFIDTQPHNQDSADEPERFISAKLDKARLDKAVKQHFDLPWNKARTWIDTGKIFLNGTRITERDKSVATGDRIELRMSAPKAQPKPDLDPKEVIYFDDEIVIVNKPAGTMTVPHPDSDETSTLDRQVMMHLRAHDSNTNKNRSSLGVVHRIDKETSGLIVFARNGKATQGLSEQFRAHTIERKYLAIVHGKMKPQTIHTRIARDNGDGIRGSVPEGATNKLGEELGRTAITHVEIVEKLQGATLVACRIETGRTHQIRIHLSEAGHPIVGEKVYIRSYKEDLIPAYRVMLHAAELGFMHPKTNEPVNWIQPTPRDFKNRLKSLRKVTPPSDENPPPRSD